MDVTVDLEHQARVDVMEIANEATDRMLPKIAP